MKKRTSETIFAMQEVYHEFGIEILHIPNSSGHLTLISMNLLAEEIVRLRKQIEKIKKEKP